jgi:hypothetical protein
MREVHESHRMSEITTEIIAPCGTPRFYSYRYCEKCEHEQYKHAAGKFCDQELLAKCKTELME